MSGATISMHGCGGRHAAKALTVEKLRQHIMGEVEPVASVEKIVLRRALV